jgi:iron complex outermembrane recepter protein
VTGLADIDAQKATTLEIGSRGHWNGLEWDASIYRSWLRDELMSYNVGIAGASATVNADRTVHQGVELGFGWELAKNLLPGSLGEDALVWHTAYTFSDFRFDGDATYGDNRIPGAPEHYIRSELRYEHPAGWFIAPQLEWVPKGYAIDMANTFSTDGYALFGLNTGFTVTKDISVYIDLRNLKDEKYAATTGVITDAGGTDQAQFLPGDGRAVYAGLRVKW